VMRRVGNFHALHPDSRIFRAGCSGDSD
jgi:hypothetical protein